jgi:hypothetical protein
MTELPSFAFSTIHDASLQLREAARANGVEVHPVPYLRFNPEDDWTWWLSPFPDNPAYAYGKVVIEKPSDASDGEPLIGLHVEKGVGPVAAPAFEEAPRDHRLVMGNDWTWHAFLRDMRSGAVDRALNDAAAAADGLPLRVVLIATPQAPGRLEPTDDQRVDAERVWFDVIGGLLRRRDSDNLEMLRGLRDEESLASIATTIDAIPAKDLDWRWFEVLIGIPYRREAAGAMSAGEVWRRACAPWLRWVR